MPYVNSKNVEEIVILTGGRQKILDELGQPLKIVHLSPVSQKKKSPGQRLKLFLHYSNYILLFISNVTFTITTA